MKVSRSTGLLLCSSLSRVKTSSYFTGTVENHTSRIIIIEKQRLIQITIYVKTYNLSLGHSGVWLLSNWNEAELLLDKEYQEKMAWAIHLGIMRCLNNEEEHCLQVII